MANPIELFDPIFDNLTRAMRIESLKQEVTAHNIANAKTPGYEALTFDEHLMKAVKRTDRKKVALEEELAALTQNKYSEYVRLLTSKIGMLKTIVTQGKK